MTPLIRIKPGVQLKGIAPEMTVALIVTPVIFGRFGYDCWLTSAVRPMSTGLHRSGLALDFDSSTNISESTGHEIALRVREYLGADFDVLWHGPRWHLHEEFDPKVE